MRKTSFYMLYVIMSISFILIITLVGDTRPGNVPAVTPAPDKHNNRSTDDEKTTGLNTAVLEAAVFMESGSFEKLEKLNKQFESLHPGITVHIENMASNSAYNQLKKEAQLGIAPDIMMLDNVWVSEFAALGYLSHQVDEYFTNDMQSRQLEPIVSQLKWNGIVWGVPKDIDPYILIWNKQRLSSIQINRPPLTSDEWINWNRSLYEPDKEALGIYLDPEDPFAFISLVWAMGGEWNVKKDIPAPDEKGITFLKALLQNGKDQEVRLNGLFQPSEKWDALKSGNIAMLVSRASEFNRYIVKGADNEIGFAELPAKKPDESASWLYGSSYAVSSRTDHEEEALKWIETMTREESQIMLMMAGSGFPTYVSSYQGNDVKARTHFSELRKSILHGRVFPAQPQLPRQMLMLQLEIAKVLSGKADVDKLAVR